MRLEVTPHQGKDFGDQRVADGIKDLVSRFPVNYNLFRAEYREVLGGIRLLNPQFLDQRARRKLALAKQFDNGNARRMPERLKHLRLEAAQCILHFPSIDEYSIFRIY